MFAFVCGILLCLFTMSLFLYIRISKDELSGLLAKIIASFSFVIFAVFLTGLNAGLGYIDKLACSCLICGLVAGLIGDILLDLKVAYPFQQDKYLKSGMTSFSIGHVFYIVALFLFTNNYTNLFTAHWIELLCIFIGAILLTLIVWLISVKALKLKYGNFTFFVNFYSFLLLFTMILSILVSCLVTAKPFFILPIGFTFFFASDAVLSTQYFGAKQDNKSLIFVNHLLYYLAQIIIASFIFFV